jgi:hypothetical protein
MKTLRIASVAFAIFFSTFAISFFGTSIVLQVIQ